MKNKLIIVLVSMFLTHIKIMPTTWQQIGIANTNVGQSCNINNKPGTIVAFNKGTGIRVSPKVSQDVLYDFYCQSCLVEDKYEGVPKSNSAGTDYDCAITETGQAQKNLEQFRAQQQAFSDVSKLMPSVARVIVRGADPVLGFTTDYQNALLLPAAKREQAKPAPDHLGSNPGQNYDLIWKRFQNIYFGHCADTGGKPVFQKPGGSSEFCQGGEARRPELTNLRYEFCKIARDPRIGMTFATVKDPSSLNLYKQFCPENATIDQQVTAQQAQQKFDQLIKDIQSSKAAADYTDITIINNSGVPQKVTLMEQAQPIPGSTKDIPAGQSVKYEKQQFATNIPNNLSVQGQLGQTTIQLSNAGPAKNVQNKATFSITYEIEQIPQTVAGGARIKVVPTANAGTAKIYNLADYDVTVSSSTKAFILPSKTSKDFVFDLSKPDNLRAVYQDSRIMVQAPQQLPLTKDGKYTITSDMQQVGRQQQLRLNLAVGQPTPAQLTAGSLINNSDQNIIARIASPGQKVRDISIAGGDKTPKNFSLGPNTQVTFIDSYGSPLSEPIVINPDPNPAIIKRFAVNVQQQMQDTGFGQVPGAYVYSLQPF